MNRNGNGKHGIDVELSDQELDYLKKLHVAQTLADLMRHPGWAILQELTSNMIERLENQHLNFAVSGNTIASRDAYWASGVRLGGARDFAKVLQDELAKRVDILNQPLQAPKPVDPTDYDGDMKEQ